MNNNSCSIKSIQHPASSIQHPVSFIREHNTNETQYCSFNRTYNYKASCEKGGNTKWYDNGTSKELVCKDSDYEQISGTNYCKEKCKSGYTRNSSNNKCQRN